MGVEISLAFSLYLLFEGTIFYGQGPGAADAFSVLLRIMLTRISGLQTIIFGER